MRLSCREYIPWRGPDNSAQGGDAKWPHRAGVVWTAVPCYYGGEINETCAPRTRDTWIQAMLLNRFEKVMMNNPVRAAFQCHFEAPRLLAMGGKVQGGLALEVGCGRGVGVEIILDVFGAAHVDAFDFDPEMVALAAERLASRGSSVRLWQGDAAAIAAPAAFYDAVFDFGIIHHVPDWRRALVDVFRVLKPGGRFLVEEVLSGFIDNPLGRRFLDHPLDDRFDHERFRAGLVDAGFRVIASNQILGLVGWYAAIKPSTP